VKKGLRMSVNCPLCASGKVNWLTNKLRFSLEADVYRCGECGLVFLDQSSFDFPDDFYESQYHQTYLTHIDPDMLEPEKHFNKMKKATAIWIDRVREQLDGTERLLDIGCSTGHLLDGVRKSAAQVHGQELNRQEIDFCRKTLGLDVSDQPLAERFAADSVDVVTLIFVLEHIGEPLDFLKEIHRVLKPGGKLIIVVPNIMDPLLSFFDIPKFTEFYYCIEHLYYYSPATLRTLLGKAGFEGEPVGVQEYPISNHLNWAYRQGPSETLSARQVGPDVRLRAENVDKAWEQFWNNVDGQYRDFLDEIGFSDRVWCIASKP